MGTHLYLGRIEVAGGQAVDNVDDLRPLKVKFKQNQVPQLPCQRLI